MPVGFPVETPVGRCRTDSLMLQRKCNGKKRKDEDLSRDLRKQKRFGSRSWRIEKEKRTDHKTVECARWFVLKERGEENYLIEYYLYDCFNRDDGEDEDHNCDYG